MRLLVRHTILGGCLLLCACASALADPLVFNVAGKAALARLSVGEFAPGTLERGAIETQTPTVRLAATDLQLAIESGGDTDCGAGLDTAAALGKANAVAATSPGDCLFSATLTVATAQGVLAIIGQCDDWRKDISYCWVEGDLGQFWLRRSPDAGKPLRIVLGPFDWAGAPVAAVGEPAPEPIPRRGIMLESVFDDAGRAVSDRWLLLPPEVVTLETVR